MDSGRFYIGTDLKFQITINATGFDQSKDKYNIDLYCGDKKLSFTQNDVINSKGNYYLVVSTSSLNPGMMRMVITAMIPDADCDDGYRNEIAVQNLGSLRATM